MPNQYNAPRHPRYLEQRAGHAWFSASVCGHPVERSRIQRCKSCNDKYKSSTKLNIRSIGQGGYVFVWIAGARRKLEHRIIVEQVMGRSLKSNEFVHHMNGVRSDNRNCNLMVCSASYHLWLERQYAAWAAKRLGPPLPEGG